MCASPARGATITVGAGGNLQQAIDSAQPGDTILLPAGATFTGNFTLSNKSGDAPITIRTAGDADLPGDSGRISPEDAPKLAKIRSANGSPAIRTAVGAHHWRLQLLELQANANGAGDIVALGDGSKAQNTASQIAHDLVLDRVYVHGDAEKGQKRGVALNSASTTITGCYIADIKAVGQDSQAIGAWNGPGPYTITNNYLEAAGENVMIGGSDPAVPNLVPADITIAGNHVAKQPAWRGESWTVKNLIELKNARRVVIERNTIEYNWQGGQSGFAVLFTVRNQDGKCPWCQVEQVTFERNIVRHSAAGIQILGYDNNHPSQQTNAITVRNNLFADIDLQNWGGKGYFLALVGGPRDITFDHNTIIQDHAYGVVQADGDPVLGFTFTNNVAKHNNYGFIGTNHGIGNDSIAAYLPGSGITTNVLAGGSASRYPSGNSFPTVAQFEAQFAAYAEGDYRLTVSSPWRGAGSDGLDLGALLDDRVERGRRSPSHRPPRGIRSEIVGDFPPGVLGAPYAGSLEASGGIEPFTWTIASGSLPPGVGFDRTSGTIAGQPQSYGMFPLTIAVRDSSSPPVEARAEIVFAVAPKPVTITTSDLPSGEAGAGYVASLSAVDGAAPLHWRVVGGQLPNGLMLDPDTGQIKGTPQSGGVMTFTVRVTDSWMPPTAATRSYALAIGSQHDRRKDDHR